MPVFDQYEVEPDSVYSGSYTDQIVFGDLFVDIDTLVTGYTPLGDSNPKTRRRLIGSRIAGKEATYPNINNMWMPGYMIDGYASGSWMGRQQRFQSFFADETWLDSYVPNPISIFQELNATLYFEDSKTILKDSALPGTYVPELSGSQFDIQPYVAGETGDGFINLLYEGYPPRSGILMPPFPNKSWRAAFPFQSTFKNLTKNFRFTKTLTQRVELSANTLGLGITPVSSSINLGTVSLYTDYAGAYVPIIVGGIMHSPSLSWPGTSAYAPNKFGTAPLREIYNFFYGFGNGVANLTLRTPSFTAKLVTDALSNIEKYIVYNIKPRGYKYGIRSIAPEQTKCIYRIGRFGQFRDMLEGRPNIAYQTTPIATLGFGGIRRTVSYPVEINFAPGTLIYSQSIDYVTATNPDYNPYDSGIYDKFYRSGQPFFDRNNED
jgi:hypothetical protein